MVQTIGNNNNGPNSIGSKNNKSPSFHSNMSVDGAGAAGPSSPGSHNNFNLVNDEAALIKAYEDHWAYEKIVLERVRFVENLNFKLFQFYF
jgi:hypothetical protein